MITKNKLGILLFITILVIASKSEAQQHWSKVDRGVGFSYSSQVNALLTDTVNNYLYIAGKFDSAGNIKSAGLTRWNIDHYEFCGNWKNFKSLCFYEGKLFIGTEESVAFFDSTGTCTPKGYWSANGPVTSLCIYRNKLYAGGKFSSVDGVTAWRIACYDGTQWSAVGDGVYWSEACCSSVDAMTVWRDKLIIGGTFDRAVNSDNSEINAGSIVAWNDTSWSAIGEMTQQTTGVNTGYIFSLGTYRGDLIVGGGSQFDFADGVPVRGIARYDGINWHSLANGVNNEVRCMVVKDTSLYVGGSVYIGQTDYDSYGVLRWDGTSFHKVDSGLGNVNALAVYDGVLYAGGGFNKKGMRNIARLLPDTVHTGVTASAVQKPQLVVYPNPVTDQLIIGSDWLAEKIEVANLLGQTVTELSLSTPSKEIEIEVSNLPEGMYLLRMKTKEGWSVTKFIKQ